jgi:hypothetical protein
MIRCLQSTVCAIALTFVCLPAVAHAAAPEPNDTALFKQYWKGVDKRAQVVFSIGSGAALGGSTVSLVGQAFEDRTLQGVGDLFSTVGIATMAGSSLRSNHAIAALGGKSAPALGIVGWSLWGLSIGTNVAGAALTFEDEFWYEDTILALSLTGTVFEVGSMLSSTGQLLVNEKHRKALSPTAALSEDTPAPLARREGVRVTDFGIAPALGRRTGVRLSISGSF